MSEIGPELPPHLLAKRKRKQQEEVENEVVKGSGANRSASPGEGEKRRRVVGPAMPPAPLDERPEEPPRLVQESDSDDDDDFGPALPPDEEQEDGTSRVNGESERRIPQLVEEPAKEKLQRDEWMTVAPTQGDNLAALMDPTKQRARAFNTGKGARGANAREEDRSTWNETPEEKRKRLADEMMGISKPTNTPTQRSSNPADTAKDAPSAQIRERTVKARGLSLLDQHQGSKNREPDDDPGKRAFDREKDMGSGMKIGHAQRKEMLNKAADFSSKFSSGSYL